MPTMQRTRRLLAALMLAACAPPAQRPAAWYDATTDTINVDWAVMTYVRNDYGDAGVAWLLAHEEGHRTETLLWRTQGVAVWEWMPGPTVAIRLEQAAQCIARARMGPEPWTRGADQIAAGYWPCDDTALLARVAAAL